MDPGLLALATLPALGLQPSQGLLAHQGLLALALLAGPPLLALAPERRPPWTSDLLAWPQAGGLLSRPGARLVRHLFAPPRARHQARPWRTLPACPDQPTERGACPTGPRRVAPLVQHRRVRAAAGPPPSAEPLSASLRGRRAALRGSVRQARNDREPRAGPGSGTAGASRPALGSSGGWGVTLNASRPSERCSPTCVRGRVFRLFSGRRGRLVSPMPSAWPIARPVSTDGCRQAGRWAGPPGGADTAHACRPGGHPRAGLPGPPGSSSRPGTETWAGGWPRGPGRAENRWRARVCREVCRAEGQGA